MTISNQKRWYSGQSVFPVWRTFYDGCSGSQRLASPMNPRRPDSLIMFTGSLWGTWNPKGSLINWVYFCLVELYAYRHAWMTCCDGGSKGVNPGGNFRLKEVSRWAFGLFHYFFKNFKIFSYFLEFSKFCTNFLQFIIIIRNYQTLYQWATEEF